mgnify:CR=1 FL=1
MLARALVFFVVLAALSGCQPGSGGSDALFADVRRQYREGREAGQWLAANGNPYALASNRFESKADARAFVAELYARGAERVVVAPDSIRPEPEEGGDYADTLIVGLPDNAVARARLVALGEAETRRDGYTLDEDLVERGYLFLWWD